MFGFKAELANVEHEFAAPCPGCPKVLVDKCTAVQTVQRRAKWLQAAKHTYLPARVALVLLTMVCCTQALCPIEIVLASRIAPGPNWQCELLTTPPGQAQKQNVPTKLFSHTERAMTGCRPRAQKVTDVQTRAYK